MRIEDTCVRYRRQKNNFPFRIIVSSFGTMVITSGKKVVSVSKNFECFKSSLFVVFTLAGSPRLYDPLRTSFIH